MAKLNSGTRIYGNVTVDTFVTATGNVTGGNLTTAGQVAATGNVSGGNLNVTGNIVDTGAMALITGGSGNISLAPNGTNTLVATTTGANVIGTLTATGNVTGGNLTTVGQVSASGNISGNYFIGNGSQLTGIAGGDTIGGNLVVLTRGGNVNFAITAGYLIVNTRASGNVSIAIAA
jgi:hypothetical protein